MRRSVYHLSVSPQHPGEQTVRLGPRVQRTLRPSPLGRRRGRLECYAAPAGGVGGGGVPGAGGDWIDDASCFLRRLAMKKNKRSSSTIPMMAPTMLHSRVDGPEEPVVGPFGAALTTNVAWADTVAPLLSVTFTVTVNVPVTVGEQNSTARSAVAQPLGKPE